MLKGRNQNHQELKVLPPKRRSGSAVIDPRTHRRFGIPMIPALNHGEPCSGTQGATHAASHTTEKTPLTQLGWTKLRRIKRRSALSPLASAELRTKRFSLIIKTRTREQIIHHVTGRGDSRTQGRVRLLSRNNPTSGTSESLLTR